MFYFAIMDWRLLANILLWAQGGGDGAFGVMFYIAYDGMDPPCWYVPVWLVNGDNAWKGFTSLSTTCDA